MTDFEQAHPHRRGACPGAGSAMATGDGLLTRVRIPGGRVSATQLQMLAILAERWGEPCLDLTSRGNAQIRGLTPEGDAAITAALLEHGLAVAPAEAEAARNVLSTPAADLDGTSVSDPWPLAQELEQAIVAEQAMWALPAKFRIVVDGGGLTTLAQQQADIRADAVSTASGLRYRLALAGSASSAQVLGDIEPRYTTTSILALAQCFVQLNSELPEPISKMTDLLAETGLVPFRQSCPQLTSPSPLSVRRPSAVIGVQPGWYGVAVPFGQLSTTAAFALAQLALSKGNGELRFTPWRQVLLPRANADIAPVLQQLGLITAEGDPRLSLTACPGAPACQSGTTATRSDGLAWARALSELFDGELAVHISGCPKGCARPQASPLTLTARNGHYDLIINDKADPRSENSYLMRDLAPTEVLPALRRLNKTIEQQRRAGESLQQVIERVDWTERVLEVRR